MIEYLPWKKNLKANASCKKTGYVQIVQAPTVMKLNGMALENMKEKYLNYPKFVT